MLGEPTDFWGKLTRSDSGSCEWHPLFDHCADVAAVVEALLELPVWRRRFTRLAGRDLGPVGWARLAALAALHDIGKLNLGFQAKGRPGLGATAGHVAEALAALGKDVLSGLDELGSWGDGASGLLVSAICHHGRPLRMDAVTSAWQASWWKPQGALNPKAGCLELLRRCHQWFPSAFEPGSTLPDVPALTHAFAGLVMLADWVGSDTRFFRFSKTADDRMPFARKQARMAIAQIGLDTPSTARVDALNRAPFARVTPQDYSVRPAQKALLSLSQDASGAITILEAETGSGKTEAALARFVQLFEAGLVDGLYFALPTRSAATQMHGRVLAATRQAFAAPPPVVLAVPEYLRVDDVEGQREVDGQRLPPFEVLWPANDERFRFRAWAAENTKRYLAGCIVVGTIDQVLLSSLMVGHSHLRASSLLRHLLVVDEVHASDAYMGHILQDVLARHLSAGGHALLLSATLGCEARARLLNPGESARVQPLEEAVASPYPLLSHRASGVAAVPVQSDGTERVVRVIREPWLETPELIAERALAAAIAGAKVLVIRNTVKDCIATQEHVERAAGARGRLDVLFSCAGVWAPHHARFARPDRTALDLALERHLGKERRPGGCVVVATQTVQQSLDIDADILFTDLCPADVMLQRIGRLHRHDRARPDGFAAARAVIVVPRQRDLGLLIREGGTARSHHGLGTVYPDLRILEATWRLLEQYDDWHTPAMSRFLVENSLHSGVLAAQVQQGGGRWKAHEIQMLGTKRGQTRQADLNLVDWSRFYKDMSFPSSADQRIPTRLGEGDRIVRFPAPVQGPFEAALTDLVVPAWMVRDLPTDVETASDVSVVQSTVHFRLGNNRFLYDRLGLRTRQVEEVHDDDGP
jgi:CRISPR-associated endonuclease/helicase Cas3